MKPLTREQLGWRGRPGILGKHPSSPQSVHALLGYFLKDRQSPTPFPGRDMLTNEELFEWGIASPLEKVIEGPEHLRLLLEVPEMFATLRRLRRLRCRGRLEIQDLWHLPGPWPGDQFA